MNNKTLSLNLSEVEDKLMETPVSDELLRDLEASSVEDAELTDVMYRYYLDAGNYDKAISFLELGDKFDDGYAQLCLASLYQLGKHCAKNEQLAQELFEKAANNGESEAQYELGLNLVLNSNSEEDVEQGVYWLNESLLNGNDDSQAILDSLKLSA